MQTFPALNYKNLELILLLPSSFWHGHLRWVFNAYIFMGHCQDLQRRLPRAWRKLPNGQCKAIWIVALTCLVLWRVSTKCSLYCCVLYLTSREGFFIINLCLFCSNVYMKLLWCPQLVTVVAAVKKMVQFIAILAMWNILCVCDGLADHLIEGKKMPVGHFHHWRSYGNHFLSHHGKRALFHLSN